MLETFEVSKVLIIAPLRVARDTWPAEIEKWDHLQGLDISVIVGDTKTRIAALHHPAMIYVINRENIKWLVEYYEKNGMRWDFGMVVIDELSSFKNYQSQRFKFLRKVRPYVKRWVGLTGTPSSNGLMDLWAEIGILDGGERLGKFIGRYREAYFKASSMNPSTGVVFQYKPREGAEELIYQRISDITISMKALDYLNMPDCVPTRYEVEMNTQERGLYDMLRQDLLIPLKDGDIDAANAASLTGKLLQMSNGAVYDENGKADRLDAVVLSTQHDPDVTQEQIHEDIKKYVFDPILPQNMVDDNTKFFINPTGRFVIGGPHGDSGLTGRKIIVDTYGGYARHGGGAFSGKDCTKVDRSAAYAARYVAKNIVAAGLADKCEIQLSYAIGVAQPTSIMVDTFETGKIAEEKLVDMIRENFDLRPAGIIKMLDLRRPIYKQTAAYGHFGRNDLDLPWERLDKVETLKKYL